MTLVNPRQQSAQQLKSFPIVIISFWGFQDFLIYLAKYLRSLLNSPYLNFFTKGVYIKHEGGGPGALYKFFKKYFVAQETIDLNISWPSHFFKKYFMATAINSSFLFIAYLQQYFRLVLTIIFKFQMTKQVNIHNNIKYIYIYVNI